MGESADLEVLNEVIQLTEAHLTVQKVLRPLSMYLAPEEIILILIATFREEVNSAEVTKATSHSKTVSFY